MAKKKAKKAKKAKKTTKKSTKKKKQQISLWAYLGLLETKRLVVKPAFFFDLFRGKT